MRTTRTITLAAALLAPSAFAQEAEAPAAPQEAEASAPAQEAEPTPPSTEAAAAPSSVEEPVASAPTQEPVAPAPSGSAPRFVVALKAGGAIPSLFSGLKEAVQGELEGGVLLLDGQLEVGAAVGYAQPPSSHSAPDPRLAGQSYSWALRQDLFVLGAHGRYRFLPSTSPFNVYGVVGPRLYLLKTTVNGESGGAAFGENRQTGTELGLTAAAGGELSLGPGRALVEFGLGAGPLQGRITGDSTASALGLTAGYRLFF